MGVAGGSGGDSGCVGDCVGWHWQGGTHPEQKHLGRGCRERSREGGDDCRKGGQRSPLKHDLISSLAPQTLPRWLPDSGET